jgi:hypothetical protein
MMMMTMMMMMMPQLPTCSLTLPPHLPLLLAWRSLPVWWHAGSLRTA